jgi:hypothetical protein
VRALEIPLDWLPEAFLARRSRGCRRQAAAALGVGPGAWRCRSCSAHQASVFTVLPRVPPPNRPACTSCHAVPATSHAMGVMLSAARSARGLRRALDAPLAEARRRAVAWEPGCEGLPSRVSPASAPVPRPGRARRVHRPLTAPRPRRALAVNAEGALRPARLAPGLRVLGCHRQSAGSRAAAPQRALAADRPPPRPAAPQRTASDEGLAWAALLGGQCGRLRGADEAVARCVHVRDVVQRSGTTSPSTHASAVSIPP